MSDLRKCFLDFTIHKKVKIALLYGRELDRSEQKCRVEMSPLDSSDSLSQKEVLSSYF